MARMLDDDDEEGHPIETLRAELTQLKLTYKTIVDRHERLEKEVKQLRDERTRSTKRSRRGKRLMKTSRRIGDNLLTHIERHGPAISAHLCPSAVVRASTTMKKSALHNAIKTRIRVLSGTCSVATATTSYRLTRKTLRVIVRGTCSNDQHG